MIKLTVPNGEPVEIDPKAISSIRANDGDFSPKAKTVLIVAGQHQAVVETMDEIDKLIAGA